MSDELRDDELVKKVGGRFKLSTLIQKRLVSLNKNSRPLVAVKPGMSNLEIVIQEIVQDKIFLSLKNELQTVEDTSPLDEKNLFDSIGFESASERGPRI